MRFRRTLRVESRIPFVVIPHLLILCFMFLMITTLAGMEKGFRVSLPRAAKSELLPEGRIARVWIDAAGTLELEDSSVGWEELAGLLEGRVRASPGLIVSLHCDQNAAVALVARAIDAAKTAGVPIAFTTRPGGD